MRSFLVISLYHALCIIKRTMLKIFYIFSFVGVIFTEKVLVFLDFIPKQEKYFFNNILSAKLFDRRFAQNNSFFDFFSVTYLQTLKNML